MNFNYKIQQYQTDEIDAIVNVFKGHGDNEITKYNRDIGTIRCNRGIALDVGKSAKGKSSQTDYLSHLRGMSYGE